MGSSPSWDLSDLIADLGSSERAGLRSGLVHYVSGALSHLR